MLFLKQHIFHILSDYAGEIPLAHYLKAYFKNHAQLGSRDRRSISEAVYGYYRLSRFLPGLSPEDLIRFGLHSGLIRHPFLNRVFETVFDQDEAANVRSVELAVDKTHSIEAAIQRFESLLPLSGDLTKKEWAETLIRQRALFIRIRQNTHVVKAILEENKLLFTALLPDTTLKKSARSEEFPVGWSSKKQTGRRMEDTTGDAQSHLKLAQNAPMEASDIQSCLVLENSVSLDKYLAPQDYVIQDLAVQSTVLKIAGYFRRTYNDHAKLQVWDTCAGAGGKTLYWKDLFNNHTILATDRRASILHNLRQRARLYSATNIKTKVLDFTHTDALQMVQHQFDLILCDVPCSGSGTWGRTPEQFHFADARSIHNFPGLQYQIVSEAISKLRPGGLLAYITCSAFKAENEAVAEKIATTMPVRLVHQELIRNAAIKSDIIYLALFRRDAPAEPS